MCSTGHADKCMCKEHRSARWMHAASAHIRRDGALPGGSPAHTGMRLQGLAFQAREHARGGGEEVVMVAGRRG